MTETTHQRTPCAKCGVMILQLTARSHGGFCPKCRREQKLPELAAAPVSKANTAMIYDPTEDIVEFRDYRAPWAYVDCPEMQFHSPTHPQHPLAGERVRPIAFDASRKQVLLHRLEGGYPLAICRARSPVSDFGELDGYFENIWEFSYMEGSMDTP